MSNPKLSEALAPKPVKILAIDPGPKESAYVIWDGSNVVKFAKVPNSDLRELMSFRPQLRYERVFIEMIGHYGTGMPAGAEVFDTCVWIGRFIECSWYDPTLVKRVTIKTHLCGSARAKDGNVRQALIDRLGAPGTKNNPGPTYGISGDVWQALALAVYAYDTTQRSI